MRARSAVAAALAVAALGLGVGAWLAGAEPKRVDAYPSELPEGPGASIARSSCLACHSAMLITQQHKDSAGWEKTVATMESWSGKVADPSRDTLMRYLRERFGPRR